MHQFRLLYNDRRVKPDSTLPRDAQAVHDFAAPHGVFLIETEALILTDDEWGENQEVEENLAEEEDENIEKRKIEGEENKEEERGEEVEE